MEDIRQLEEKTKADLDKVGGSVGSVDQKCFSSTLSSNVIASKGLTIAKNCPNDMHHEVGGVYRKDLVFSLSFFQARTEGEVRGTSEQ